MCVQKKEKILKYKGQSVIEYAVLLSALCLVFLTMIIYLKGSVNARFRVIQDRLNTEAQN